MAKSDPDPPMTSRVTSALSFPQNFVLFPELIFKSFFVRLPNGGTRTRSGPSPFTNTHVGSEGNLFSSATNTHSDFPFRLAARATIHFLNPLRKRKAQLSICLLNFKIIFLFCLSPCNITWQKRALRSHAPRTRPYTTKLKLVLKTLRNEREREARVARESEKQPESGPIVRAEKFQEISNCEDFSLISIQISCKLKVLEHPNECRSSSSLSSRHTTQAGYRMIHFAKCWPWIGQRTARCPMPASSSMKLTRKNVFWGK